MKYDWPLDKVFDGENAVNEFKVDSAYFKENLYTLARVYVPFQRFENIYEPMDALKHGTAFKDLYQPEYRLTP